MTAPVDGVRRTEALAVDVSVRADRLGRPVDQP